MRLLIDVAVRTPKLAIAIVVMLLVALAGISAYAGYLVIGVVAGYLGTGRFLAGLLLGILFLRLPRVRQGKLSTVGLLPKAARLPIVVALLAASMLNYFYDGNTLAVACLVLAASLLVLGRWMKFALVSRVSSFFSKSAFGTGRSRKADSKIDDSTIIDAEFRERKD
ncbi:MAG: hypothetical protein V4695_11510 [Pseudomonadota bacterium]